MSSDDASSSSSFDDSSSSSSSDSSAVVVSQSTNKVNETPKLLNAPWFTNNSNYGEAGNFVEVSTRGGIMQYSKIFKRAYLVSGPDDRRILPKSYLKAYTQNQGPTSLLRFDHPPGSEFEGKRMVRSDLKTKTTNSLYFPFNDVDDLHCYDVDLHCQSPSLSEPYHGYFPNDVLKL